MQRPLASLARSDTGVTVAEFALLAPVLVMTLMGLFDMTYNFYADTVVEGVVANAARDSSIEQFANDPDALDDAVEAAIHRIVPNAAVTISRTAYTDYGDVGQAEAFTDSNKDGSCNNNEPFEDVNGNGMWDPDRSLLATSGARDAVVYEVTATYDRAFPVPSLLNLNPKMTVRARTILRNQPYNLQNFEVSVGNCP